MMMYDVIAIMLIGISHVLLYIQLIRYDRLPYLLVIVVSVVFMILLGFVVTVTNYPEFNIIMLLLFLLSIGLLKADLTFVQNLYFTLFSVVVITYAKLVLMELGMSLFMLSPLNLYIWTDSVIHLVISSIIFLSVVVLRKTIRQFSQFIVNSSLYYVSYVVLIVGLLLGFVLNFPSSHFLNTLHQQYGQESYIAAFILFFVLLLIILVGSHAAKERLLEEHQKQLDRELMGYVEKLELAHDELTSFRHDYINILLSLDEGVRNQNLPEIQQVYYDVIAPTSKAISNHELDIVKLARISIPEVKSVLSVKIISAQQKRLEVVIDIPEVIEEVFLSVTTFIRVISILLDNAIEEAVNSKEKVLQVSFFEKGECQYFIVSNSCQQKAYDLQQLYEKSYTSKEGDRGYGLFSLKRLIDKTANATLETTFTDSFFTQSIILKQ